MCPEPPQEELGQEEDRTPRRRGCLGCLLGLLLLAVAAALLWKPALHGVARFLVVSDPPQESDLVVVHAGEPGRLQWGVELVQQKKATSILVFLDPTYQRGFFGLTPEAARTLCRESLLDEGLSESQITLIQSVYSTWDEGNQALEYLHTHPEVRKVLVVSSPFHMRRVRAVWRDRLETMEHPPEVRFVPVPWERTGVQLEEWWTRERELIWVHSEYTKLVLYHLRHF